MATILCLTRGGKASRPNQDRAIAIARERGDEVLFLYVSDVRFLDQLASPILVDVQEELDEMGEFMLAMAQERAEKAGVRARTEVRRGVFREALQAAIQEHHAGTVVLGSSAEGTGLTSLSFRQDLIAWLHQQTGVEVIAVNEGEVVGQHLPADKSATQ